MLGSSSECTVQIAPSTGEYYNATAGTVPEIEVIGDGDNWILSFRSSTLVEKVWINQAMNYAIPPDGSGSGVAQGGIGLIHVEFHPDKTIAEVRNLLPIFSNGSSEFTDDLIPEWDVANLPTDFGGFYIEAESDGDQFILADFLELLSGNFVLTDQASNTVSKAAASGVNKIGGVYGVGKMQLMVGGDWSAEVNFSGTLYSALLKFCPGALFPARERGFKSWADGTKAEIKAEITALAIGFDSGFDSGFY